MRIPGQIHEAMVAHAYFCHPEESCGLLASDGDGNIRMAYPLTNSLHSRTNYTIEPIEHFRALKHAEASGWEISGVFHSHPHTGAYPSETDVRLAAEPDWLYIVVGMEQLSRPEVCGFRITAGSITDVPFTFEENKWSK